MTAQIGTSSEAISLLKQSLGFLNQQGLLEIGATEAIAMLPFAQKSQQNCVVKNSDPSAGGKKVYHSRCGNWFYKSALKTDGKTSGKNVRVRKIRYVCPVCSKTNDRRTFTGDRPGHPLITRNFEDLI